MEKITRLAISLPRELFEEFEGAARRQAYSNRSKAIADALRAYLSTIAWRAGEGRRIGVISLLYAHHVRGTLEKLTDTQHAFSDVIVSSTHAHLDKEDCLEIIVTRGNARRIEKLFHELKAARGVKGGKMSVF